MIDWLNAGAVEPHWIHLLLWGFIVANVYLLVRLTIELRCAKSILAEVKALHARAGIFPWIGRG